MKKKEKKNQAYIILKLNGLSQCDFEINKKKLHMQNQILIQSRFCVFFLKKKINRRQFLRKTSVK